MRRRPALLAALAAALAAAPARASNPGTTAAPVLEIPLGARANGMGTAFTGLADNIDALYYNPAGLSTLQSREASFMYVKGFSDQSIQHMAIGGPIPFAGLFNEGYTSLAASLLLASQGTIEVNTLNADGSLASSQSLQAGSDMVATLGYSERVAEFDVPTKGGDSIPVENTFGFSGKWIRSTLAETYHATAWAGDLGYLVRLPDQGFGLGASVQNIGTQMTFISEGDPLPLTYRFGMSYKPMLPDTLTLPAQQQVTFTGDALYWARERAWRGMVGAEYTMLQRFSVRLGYRLNDSVGGFTAGFGAGWGPLSMDYAWGMSSDLTDTHRFSFTWRFGRVSQRERERTRKPYIESMPDQPPLKTIEQEKPDMLDQPVHPRSEAAPSQGKSVPGWIY
ncbi:MAG: PorV/PorQ family protein [Elusimicrobia bacterium]|nr:PorV/PorQ family protein [Elusimicrobiota bacterium]